MGAGNDELTIGEGVPHSVPSTLEGGTGSDKLVGGAANDVLYAGEDHDPDTLEGGGGNDVLYGVNIFHPKKDSGAATMNGGPGSDLMIGGQPCDGDTFNGGPGANDSASFARVHNSGLAVEATIGGEVTDPDVGSCDPRPHRLHDREDRGLARQRHPHRRQRPEHAARPRRQRQAGRQRRLRRLRRRRRQRHRRQLREGEPRSPELPRRWSWVAWAARCPPPTRRSRSSSPPTRRSPAATSPPRSRDMDPEVEWIEPLSFEMGGRRVGPAAVAEYLEASRAGWKHLTSEPTAHRVGPEIVVVHRSTASSSTAPRRRPKPTDVFRFREGRIGRMRAYEAPEEAFAAAPLRRWIDAYRAAWESNDPDGDRRPLHRRRRLPDRALGILDRPRGDRRRLARARRQARRHELPLVARRPRRRPLDRRGAHQVPQPRQGLLEPLAGRPRRRGARPRLQRVVEAVARRRSRLKRPSLRMRFAALWPEAAITPPPGWVPAPQR